MDSLPPRPLRNKGCTQDYDDEVMMVAMPPIRKFRWYAMSSSSSSSLSLLSSLSLSSLPS